MTHKFIELKVMQYPHKTTINSAPLNTLAGYEVTFRGGRKRGERRRRKGKGKKGKARKELEKTSPNKFLLTPPPKKKRLK